MKIIQTLGATPLDPEEMEALIPKFVTTMADLNAYEAANILDAQTWLLHRKRQSSDVLTLKFLLQLHKKMFSKTWLWAGKFRQSNKNIGCDKAYIVEEVKILLGDVEYWLTNKCFPTGVIIARFHHRLVKIHPFSNGNGRHARMAADALAQALGSAPFTWGSEMRVKKEVKERYIAALQAADKNDYRPLLIFLGVDQ